MATGAYADRMDRLSKDQEIIAAAIAVNAPFVGRLRSRTLVSSRWFALIGQFITVLVVLPNEVDFAEIPPFLRQKRRFWRSGVVLVE